MVAGSPLGFSFIFFFFNVPATTEIYTLHIVGSVRCVQETVFQVPLQYLTNSYQSTPFLFIFSDFSSQFLSCVFFFFFRQYLYFLLSFFFLMYRRPPRSTHCISSAASDVYKRQYSKYLCSILLILISLHPFYLFFLTFLLNFFRVFFSSFFDNIFIFFYLFFFLLAASRLPCTLR
eukprot:TRINITY_DN8324_c0_g1_i1.p1 TRINITY_DN8324_c0_g1~~TRINITY_DN8324_c0_g1_i1.p1  ORF type:complete len:176 (+),score=30.67 TRINITY_DN8324_c0_g1_i1:61-588(+)